MSYEKKLLEVARAVRASLDAERGPNVDAAISDRDDAAEAISPGQFIRLHCCEAIAFSDLCRRFNMSATEYREALASSDPAALEPVLRAGRVAKEALD